MTTETARGQVVVLGDHIVHLTIDEVNRPESVSLDVAIDGNRLRGWEEPGWRGISLGALAELFYWWSARRIVVLALDPAAVAAEIAYDEDILFVFHLGGVEWLVVGESSVSTVSAGIAISRLEFGEVIVACRRDGDVLAVETSDSSSFVIALEPDGLRLQT
jgi:hypothetical protein